jgi:hypothetical protein
MSKRRNPEVEALEKQVAYLLGVISRMRVDTRDAPFAGCGDSSCVSGFVRGGMHTNGGCRCSERALRMQVMWWRRRAEFLQVSLQDLRDRRDSSEGETNA